MKYNNEKFAQCLRAIQNDMSQGKDAPAVRLKEFGFTGVLAEAVKMHLNPFCEITEKLCEVIRATNLKMKQAKKRERNAQLAEEADKPLPLANKEGKGLEQYDPRELIAELRCRGFKGNLYYTQVKEINV